MTSTIVVLLTGTLLSNTPASGAATNVCTNADVLWAAGRSSEAEQEYSKLLRADSTNRCALAGLKAITDARCTAADQLLAAGRSDVAKQRYEALLGAEPTLACAIVGLQTIATQEERAKPWPWSRRPSAKRRS